MNLFDTPAGFDEPLAMWMGCHRRIEKQLATLERLRRHLAEHGVDPEATSAAQAILRYFDKSAIHHHEDEELDLFPLLDRRIADATDLNAFRALRERLMREHERMAAAWARLRKPLQGIAEGIARPLDAGEIEAFRALYAEHIPAEDGALPEYARRYLTAEDMESLGRSMAARRGVPYLG